MGQREKKKKKKTKELKTALSACKHMYTTQKKMGFRFASL